MAIKGHFCYQQFLFFLVVVDFLKIAHHSSQENLGSLQPRSLRAVTGQTPTLKRAALDSCGGSGFVRGSLC